MNLAFEPSGVNAKATRDSILQNELAKLQKYKCRLKGENEKYLENHPELRPILDDFMGAIFRDKPSDIVKFGTMYFGALTAKAAMGPSPLVVSGPPQIGRTTFIRMLIERYPGLFGYAVVHCTRAAREGEVNGVDFHFIDRAAFAELEEKGEFVDTYVLHTNSYAISRAAVAKVRSEGKICVLDLNSEGVERVRSSDLDCKFLFISPASIEAYQDRLKKRGTETEDRLQAKVAQATADMASAIVNGPNRRYDYILVNDDLDAAFEELVYLLQGWYPQIEDYNPSIAAAVAQQQQQQQQQQLPPQSAAKSTKG